MIRRSCGTTVARRLLIGAIALLVPALAGCEAGLNAPTLDFHPASNGASTVENNISINNVFVLGGTGSTAVPKGGSAALFIALYNGGSQDDRLLGIAAPGSASSVKVASGSVNLPPGAAVNLTGPEPKVVLTGVTKALSGGETIEVILDFARAGVVTLQVPVEPHSYYYGSYSPPAPTPTATLKAKGTATPTARPSGTATATVSATSTPKAKSTPKATASPTATATPAS